MCTIVAIKGRHPHCPLVLAANRDEFYARPATPPRVVQESPRVVAGIDEQSGGTWLGAHERGVFVALTNQRQYAGADPAKRSRGPLVLEALALGDVGAIGAMLEALDPREYNAFNLFYGDAERLEVAYARADRADVEIEALADGVWVLPNDRIGSSEFPKTRRALELVEPLVDGTWDALSGGLERALGDHREPSIDQVPAPPDGSRFDRATLQRLQALCVHTPIYGTRSATILALAPGRVARYRYADGPPCTTPFADVTELFE